MAKNNTSFHTTTESAQLNWASSAAMIDKSTVIKERSLSYRFYPHYHPYVGDLIRRLNEGRVAGLQAADTDYVTNKDGTWAVLPDTTRAVLAESVQVVLDGKPVTLPAGAQVTLPDKTRVTLDGGGQADLPGSLVVSPQGGVKLTLTNQTKTHVSGGTVVTLTAATQAPHAGGLTLALPAGAKLALFGGRPRPVLYQTIFSGSSYKPTGYVEQPYPVRDLDFTPSGAYSVYNWELFFHVPLTIAIHLSKNQRYEDALRWFHLIFDPNDASEGPTPERFWKVKPFQFTDVRLIEEILVNLASGADPQLRNDTINSIAAWKDDPFRPHVVARYRQPAFMFKTVMAYLDNLIDWGDSLFRQDTGEAINEATQLYVLAASILGPRPQAVPRKASVRTQTYASLRADLDKFGNVLREAESEIGFDLAPPPAEAGDLDRYSTLRSLGHALYFCVPRNDKLLTYWDTVADRLFKIRNSLNIQGIFRQLPLFEPPIDPGLLAKAAAAGLDIGAVISGLNQPLPLVRFHVLIQKAIEICQEVKTLGSGLLAAMEKEDNEELAIMRARHERMLLALSESVKYAQLQEAIKAREGVERTLANAVQSYVHYERLLGRNASEITIPGIGELDTDALIDKLKFKSGEPEVAPRDIPVDIDPGATGGLKMSRRETGELDRLSEAQIMQDVASGLELGGSVLRLIPTTEGKTSPLGVGLGLEFGGYNLGDMMMMAAAAARGVADRFVYEAEKTSKLGSYERREQEWAFHSNAAAGEITQIFKQLRAAQIREAIAEREWTNHKAQIVNARAIEQFLTDEKKGKATRKSLYTWMKRETRALYGQCFQFAFDVARKAERALQHELGDPQLSYLQFGYLSGRDGLLAGERLHLDLKRMEISYHDLNRREYELTKHVSLIQVDPHALIQLRTIGRCTVRLPEQLFDMDGPGQYFRRIRTVAVSVPAVVGPYTSVNCKLTLLKSSIRRNPLLRDGAYAREGAEDDRFSDNFSSLQSVVTSGTPNDTGTFEVNLRDDRYLPFEGHGVISEWQLELPADPAKGEPMQFDYSTIADVILHIRYTAREGGALLRAGAVSHLAESISLAQAAGSTRLLDVRREFPTEWARFRSVTLGTAQPVAELSLMLREEHYPFWSVGRLEALRIVTLFARTSATAVTISEQLDGAGNQDTLVKDDVLGGLRIGALTNIPLPAPTGPLSLFFDDNSMEDLWLAVAWGAED